MTANKGVQMLDDIGMFFRVLRSSSHFMATGYQLDVTKADYDKARAAYDALRAAATEMAFIEACDEAECGYDNEALLKAIADLKARARPSSDRPSSSHCWCGLHVTLKNRCDRCMERGVFARPASAQDGVREAIPTSVGSVGKP